MLFHLAIILPVSLFISVVIAYYAVFKLKNFSWDYKQRRIYWDKYFNKLVRQKIWELGLWGSGHKGKKKGTIYQADKRATCLTLKLLTEKINLDKRNQGLLYLYEYLDSIDRYAVRLLEPVLKGIESFTGHQIAPRYVVEHARKLLYKDVFLISEREVLFLDIQEIEKAIMAYVFLHLLVEDAVKWNATVSKVIIRKKMASEQIIFKAIEFFVLQKSGASQQVLFEEIIQKHASDCERLKKLNDHKKHIYIMNLITRPGFTFRTLFELMDQLTTVLQTINRLKNEYMARMNQEKQRAKYKARDEQNSRKEQENSHKKKYNQFLEEFEILGCDSNCSIKQIKKRFKVLAMEKHPDRFSSDKDKMMAHEDFIRIKNAYEKVMKRKKAA